MSDLPLQPLQAALLFENAAQFATQFPCWEDVVTDINAMPLGIGIGADVRSAQPFRILPGATSDGLATLSNGDLHITIERLDGPLAVDGFAPVLAQPYYAKMKPDLVDGVNAHQCALLFNVGLGEIPMPIDHALFDRPGMLDAIGVSQDQEKFEQRLLLVQAATLAFYRHFTPSVVHWGQSDQLFAGNEYQAIASTGFALPLYVHPGFGTSGKKVKGSFCTGVNAYGAEHLIGRHVEFAEHPQAMAKSYELVLGFIAYCRNLGRLLDDGEVFSLGEDGDVIEVHHMEGTEQHPDGVIELRLREGASASGGRVVKVRPSLSRFAATLLGRRNALSGKDAPDMQAVPIEKPGGLGGFFGGLVTKLVGLAVIALLLTSGGSVVQGTLIQKLSANVAMVDISALTDRFITPEAKIATALPSSLKNAPRTAPVLFQPALPNDL